MNLYHIKYKDIEQVPLLKISQNFKQDFQGSAPAPFIGRFGYPRVNMGILSPQFSGDMERYDSPKLWSAQQFPIGSIASLRYSLVNSRTRNDIHNVHQGKFLEIVQETALAKRAVEVEVSLRKPPQLTLKQEADIMPFGPGSELQTARLTNNPGTESAVEKVVADTDLKAAPALLYLYQKGFEENSLTKLFSVGTIGLKKNRTLVPTRWSITAVDDTIGKQLITEVKELPLGEYQAFFGGAWGNYYLMLFFPEVWGYELFENHLAYKQNPWSKQGYAYATDHEAYEGRKTYAEETAGGYYAARLPVLEKMKLLKRQHSCLALRFITSEYTIPLGVWVCREAARKSLANQPLSFASSEELLRYATSVIQQRFNFSLPLLLENSKLLKERKQQKKLSHFFG